MNWGNPEVKYVFEMMNWWFDKGIDRIRVDAITHIKKTFEAGDLPVPEGKTYAPAFDVDMKIAKYTNLVTRDERSSLSKYDMTVGEANACKP